MLKIVHFGKYYFPDPGGIESVTQSLACGAVAAGHNVSVICFKKSIEKNEEIINGVNILRAPIAWLFSSQPLGIRYLYLCLRAAKTADVIHLHAPNILAALCAILIGPKSKLIVHWHSDVINKGILEKLVRPLEHAALKKSDCVIVASPPYAKFSIALAKYYAKVIVVPYGVKSSIASAPNFKLDKVILEKITGKEIILSVGRLVDYKGFEVLIRSAKYLPESSIVVIVGDGPLRTYLQQEIDKGQLSDRVILVGHLSEESLRYLFAHATLYCLPSKSRAEAFGVVLIEAMSYGLPIVASNILGSGAPWINEHGVTGLNVPVGDSEALAIGIKQILNSSELQKKFSLGANRRFLSEFTEEIFLHKVMTLYEELALN
jgi:glycosyltransferase involved in cell wall biosynthesis